MEFAGNGLIFVTGKVPISHHGTLKVPLFTGSIGSPGSGKGTLCKKLAAQYGFRHQSIGDMLRQMIASSTASDMISDYIPRGQVLPAEVLFEVLKTSLGELSGKHPFLLDGFPRKFEQATPVEAEVRDIPSYGDQKKEKKQREREMKHVMLTVSPIAVWIPRGSLIF
jgi:adenylate kinase family enzyme